MGRVSNRWVVLLPPANTSPAGSIRCRQFPTHNQPLLWTGPHRDRRKGCLVGIVSLWRVALAPQIVIRYSAMSPFRTATFWLLLFAVMFAFLRAQAIFGDEIAFERMGPGHLAHLQAFVTDCRAPYAMVQRMSWSVAASRHAAFRLFRIQTPTGRPNNQTLQWIDPAVSTFLVN